MELEIEWSVPGQHKRSSPKQAGPKLAATIEQARLDRIYNPAPIRGQSHCSWVSKMRRDPAYTSEWLMVRLTELRDKIEALNSQVRYDGKPPAGVTVPEYYRAWDKLDRLQGQADAILQVLEERARSGGGSSRTPISIGAALAAGPDPFADQ